MTSLSIDSGTTSGPELLLHLTGRGRRAQLEDRLREAVRAGVLGAGMRLPSSRLLAEQLGVSRRLVVDAYGQLQAEGYLASRHGSGTFVAAPAPAAPEPAADQRTPPLGFDFFPGAPDLSSFPRSLWLRALRTVISSAPASAFGYPDARGAPQLRTAIAAYLRRVRGVVADPGSVVICSGATQGLAVLGRALRAVGAETIAVEDPSLPPHRDVLARSGLRVDAIPVDERGLDVARLAGQDAVLTTPAHQCPTGVVLSAERRAALIDWARRGGRFVLEDDYDAEFRYDRAPLGAVQGLAPERVAYIGTTSKTLAPALRIGWLVLPAELVDATIEAKLLEDFGSPTIEQLALARLIETAAYDRFLRQARRRNRARRDALVAAVGESLPRARVSGISAGLHALVRFPEPFDGARVAAELRQRSVGVYPLSFHTLDRAPETDALVLGYANLSEPAIREGIRRIADVLG
jgi:GntR family transcriptional regulator/MocR family aminotransferase